MSAQDYENAPLIISLNQIMSDYEGDLSQALSDNGADDVLIHWSVEMDVAERGMQTFFVMMAVCWTDMTSQDAHNLLVQMAPEKMPQIFCFIPACDYGTDDFGVFIAENEYGDILTNGIINEMVTQANVEKAVIETQGLTLNSD